MKHEEKKMDNVQRRDMELPYVADEEVCKQQKKARALTQKLNSMDRSDFDGIRAVLKELLGKSEDLLVNPPFYCDYGFHIEIGDGCFLNYNCTILDAAKVVIGKQCLFGPNVQIYTSGHPLHHEARCLEKGVYTYAIPVTIGDRCWIGGNTVICPGVHIGNNVVIGAGSVVVKDVPDGCLAAGNPCRVIRQITEEQRKYYFKDRMFD